MRKHLGLDDPSRDVAWLRRHGEHLRVVAGNPANWPSEALEAYLSGMSIADIAKVLDIAPTGVSRAICREALYQLMEVRQAQRLEELDLKEKT